MQAEAEAQVQSTIEQRKDQHKRWNQQWIDETWRPITPPSETSVDPPRWAPLAAPEDLYPTPPPTLPSEDSRYQDEDVDMHDRAPGRKSGFVASLSPEPEFIFHIPGAFPPDEDDYAPLAKRDGVPACRLRYGRGGRCFLEAKRRKLNSFVTRSVVSDSESDDEGEVFFAVDRNKIFDYRSAIHNRSRPDSMSGERRHWPSGDQSAMMAQQGGASQSQAASHQ